MTKKRWFKICLWVWLGSIPFMFAVAVLGDWGQNMAQSALPAGATFDQIQALNPPLWVVVAHLLQTLASLYMFLGWIPVVIFGFLKEMKPKQAK